MITQRRSGNEADPTPLTDIYAVEAWEPGPNYPNDGPDDTAWEGYSLWDQRISTDAHNYFESKGADWIWESYRVNDPIYGTYLRFEESFESGPIFGSTLYITCDNGYEVFLNGVSVGSANVFGDWKTSNLKQAYVDTSGWDVVGIFDVESYLMEGENHLVIDAANEYLNPDDPPNTLVGTQSNNPGALIYALCYEYYDHEETAWGDGDDFPGDNWATYFKYTVQGEIELDWPGDSGTTTVAFEDLPLTASLDWDYNDFVVDIETLATYFGTTSDKDLQQIDFTVIPEARGAGYNHEFHLMIPADTFLSDGEYTLTIYDENGDPLSGYPVIGVFVASVDSDYIVIPSTTEALPGFLTNTIEPTGIVSHYPNIGNTDPAAPQHQPYVPTKRTATLTIVFDTLEDFDLSAYDPYSSYHGEGLFFDPYLRVINTGNIIDAGDVRMLTVPVDWLWPEAGVGIWLAYTDVTSGNPPTFTEDWWLTYNDLVYNGKPLL